MSSALMHLTQAVQNLKKKKNGLTSHSGLVIEVHLNRILNLGVAKLNTTREPDMTQN